MNIKLENNDYGVIANPPMTRFQMEYRSPQPVNAKRYYLLLTNRSLSGGNASDRLLKGSVSCASLLRYV